MAVSRGLTHIEHVQSWVRLYARVKHLAPNIKRRPINYHNTDNKMAIDNIERTNVPLSTSFSFKLTVSIQKCI